MSESDPRRYRHGDECASWGPGVQACDCGLDQLEKRAAIQPIAAPTRGEHESSCAFRRSRGILSCDCSLNAHGFYQDLVFQVDDSIPEGEYRFVVDGKCVGRIVREEES